MTNLDSDDFELGNTSRWDSVAGTPSVQSSVKHAGTYAALFDASGDSLSMYINGAGTTIYSRMYIRFDALPANDADTMEICRYIDTGYTNVICRLYLYRDPGPVYYLVLEGNYPSTTTYSYDWSASIQTNTWYCIELGYYQNANGWYKAWIDGVNRIDSGAKDTSTEALEDVIIGRVFDYATCNLYIDDYITADTYIGPMSAIPPLMTKVQITIY